MTMMWLLAALATVPVLVVPLTTALGRRAGWPLAIAFLALAAAMLPTAQDVLAGGEVTQRIAWLPALDIDLALRLDGLGLVFVMIALVIGAAVFLYSVEYLEDGRQLGFYLWMTAFAFGMVGLVLADDLFVLFACWEITSLASFLLIARSGSGAESASARTLFMTFVGGLTLLVAVVLTTVATGTTSLSRALASGVWDDRPGFTAVVAVLVAVAGFTKAAQFPFHSWLPDAMAAATPVSAYLHAAAVVKAGIYLLLRFSEAFSDVPAWNALLISVGLLTAAMAALFAFQQHDLKRLMAYSTVSQLGLITAAIGVGTEKALTAAVIHTIAHALFKSGLFMMVGVIDHAAGTRDIRRLPELRRVMPWSFATVVLGTAGMAGIPPLLGFVSKETLLGSMLEAPGPSWVGALALAAAGIGSVLTFSYSAKIVLGAFVDGERELEAWHAPSPGLFLPAAAPIWVGLPLGLAAGVLDVPVERAVEAMGGTSAYGLELWHGLAPELFVTAGAVALGAALMTQRRRVYPVVEKDLLPGTGADALERIFDGAERLGRKISRTVAADHPRRHVVPPLVVLTLLLGVGSVTILLTGDVPATQPDLWRPVDAGLLVLIALGVLGTCLADSRIAATVSLGGVGVAVTVQLFALGAPDVGMTQLMVEVLTVLVIMMVLRLLPRRFGHSHRRPSGPLVLAGGVGLAAGLAAWLLTGRRARSVPADYYLAEGTEVTGGDNLVNVILVEFRALDTLGELAVLGLAGVAIVAVLTTVSSRTLDPPGRTGRPALRPLGAQLDPQARTALVDAQSNLRALQLLLRVLVPVLLVLSAVIFWRGHNAPGGGFIAALVASAAVALVYLSRPRDQAVGSPRLHIALIGGGVLTALVTGLLGYADSSFLQPLYGTVAGTKLSTSLLFDVGVYAAVLGLVMVAFDRLGGSPPARPAEDPPGKAAAATTDRTEEGLL